MTQGSKNGTEMGFILNGISKNEIQTGKITQETLKMPISAIFANAHF